MKKNKLLLRYGIFLIGLVCCAFGIAFITKSSLGTTPISSIPYTLSLIFPQWTLGNFSILVNLILVIVQWILLGKEANKTELLMQIPISLIFGYVIDFALWVLSFLSPVRYIEKLFVLLISCVCLAFGAWFEVSADVTMLPADGFARVLSKKTHIEFGRMKLITDSSQALIALILCLICLHSFVSVREGTLIAAVVIGNLVSLISSRLTLAPLFDEKDETIDAEEIEEI